MARDYSYWPDRDPKRRSILVFGSNKAGRHGKGAANDALCNWGAIYGLGVAMQGDSYAIPTKDARFQTLPLEEIERYVRGFIRFARSHGHRKCQFCVTALGTGLAGYEPEDIAWMFHNAPENVLLPEEFKKVLDI